MTEMLEVPAAPLITGFVALVIQPDAATIRKAYELARSLMPTASQQTLAPGSLPHVTLTQCAVRDAPRERFAEFVNRLEAQLRGLTIPLSAVENYGAGFLFWHAAPASPGRTMLQRAHEHATTVADGLLDPVANAAVVEATATAFNNDQALVENARRYGYALIRECYQPHITLGFDPRVAAVRTEHPHSMTVERVVLARLGGLGRIERVLSL